MNCTILQKYFAGVNQVHLNQLAILFEGLMLLEKVFYAIIFEEKEKYKFAYVSDTIQRITGYSVEKFSYHEGSAFFYSITPPTYRKSILEQEASYLKKARQGVADFTKPFIIEIRGALERADGFIVQARMIAVILEFTSELTPHLAVNTWQIVDNITDEDSVETTAQIKAILEHIYKIYIPQSKMKKLALPTDEPIRLSYPLYDCDILTRQEYRVLKLLADGYSSKITAEKLNISFNTAESHRRHLLQKFKAANVAEMIKKATKLYWLE